MSYETIEREIAAIRTEGRSLRFLLRGVLNGCELCKTRAWRLLGETRQAIGSDSAEGEMPAASPPIEEITE